MKINFIAESCKVSNSSLPLNSSSIIRKSKEEHKVELDYVIRTLFLRRDADKLPVILKEQRTRKVFDLVSLRTIDLENLSCTSSSEETLKLDHCKIGLVIVFKEFIKTQKLRLRSSFCSITFKGFSNF